MEFLAGIIRAFVSPLINTIASIIQMASNMGLSADVVELRNFKGEEKALAIVFRGSPDILDDFMKNVLEGLGLEEVEIIELKQAESKKEKVKK